MQLAVEGLTVTFAGRRALEDVSFSLDAGEIGCLLGPSGCGKTTALRCIAGFERPKRGTVTAGGACLTAPDAWVAPEARRIGMVFQDYALFPHLNAAANVAFGLRDLGRAARAARVAEVLTLVGLADLGGRYPHELSGGQQQRVALARALAPRPLLILLDEPFSSVDAEVRRRLSRDLRAALKQEGATALLVTHDQQEAFVMADRIGVMRDGRLEQWDSAWQLYHSPATRFVAEFVGEGAFVAGAVTGERRVATRFGVLGGRLTAPLAAGDHVLLLLRPDDVVADPGSALRATVVDRAFRGAYFLYTLRFDNGDVVLASLPSHENHPVGSELGVRLETQHLVGFAAAVPGRER